MIGPELHIINSDIRLVAPDLERDPTLSVRWLGGDSGRRTLQSMGVPDKNIHEPTIEGEEERIRGIIDSPDSVGWMIEYESRVIGAVEVHMTATDYLAAPAVVVIIGDLQARGQGVATMAVRAAVDWLYGEGEPIVFARHVFTNEASAQMLLKAGFEPDGDIYTDTDDLKWQNMILRNEE